MPVVIFIVDLYKSTRCDRQNLYGSFRTSIERLLHPAQATATAPFKMLSQRIIPPLLDHHDASGCQGLAVRTFRNMMAQKVQLPLQFPGALPHHDHN